MAAITTTVFKDSDLTERIVTGDVSASEIFEEIDRIPERRVTNLVLWDFSNASLESIRSEDIPRFADAMARHANLRVGGRTAIVVGSDAAFGLIRMYETYREIRNIHLPFLAARSRQEAIAWLMRPPR